MATLARLSVQMGFVDAGVMYGINRMLSGIDSANNRLMRVGQAATLGFTAVVVGGFASSVKAAASFEQQMSQLKAVTGATADQMKQLQDLALKTSENSIFSAEQIGLAYTELAKAGVSTQNIIGGAGQAAVVLAHATGGDLEKSAAIVAVVMNQFQLTGDQAMHVADLLTLGANTSAASVASLGQSLSYTGNMANLMGIPLEETIAMLDAMADAGLKGSRTGTNLQAMLQKLATPSDEARQIWADWGISLQDANGDFIGMDALLPQLAAHMGKLKLTTSDMKKLTDDGGGLPADPGKLEQVNLLYKLFGVQGGRAMAALLLTQTEQAKASGKSWDDYKNNLKGAGAAVEQSKILLDNLSGSWRKFRNSIHVAMIEVGLILIPTVRKVVDTLAKVVQAFIRLPRGAKAVIVAFLAIAAAIGPLLMLLPLISAAIGALFSPFLILISILGAVVAGFIATHPSITKLWDSIVKLTTAMAQAYGDSYKIQSLIKQLPSSLRGIAEPLLRIADSIGDIFQGQNSLGENLSNIFGGLGDIGIITVKGLLKLALKGGDMIVSTAGDLWNWIKNQAGLGDAAGDGTGTGSTPSTDGLTIGQMIVTGTINLTMSLWEHIVNTKDDIVNWIEKKFFTGFSAKRTTNIPIDAQAILLTDDSKIYTRAETYRTHVQGLLHDWAVKHHFLLKGITYDLDGTPHVTRTVDWSAIGDYIGKQIKELPVKGIRWIAYIGVPASINEDTGFDTGKLVAGILTILTSKAIIVPFAAWALYVTWPFLGLFLGWWVIPAILAGIALLLLGSHDNRVAFTNWILEVGIPSVINFAVGFWEAQGMPKELEQQFRGNEPMKVGPMTNWVMQLGIPGQVMFIGSMTAIEFTNLVMVALGRRELTTNDVDWILFLADTPTIRFIGGVFAVMDKIKAAIGAVFGNHGVETSPLDWKAQIQNSPSEIFWSAGPFALFYLSFKVGEWIGKELWDLGVLTVEGFQWAIKIADPAWDYITSEFSKLEGYLRNYTPEWIKKLFAGDFGGALNALLNSFSDPAGRGYHIDKNGMVIIDNSLGAENYKKDQQWIKDSEDRTHKNARSRGNMKGVIDSIPAPEVTPYMQETGVALSNASPVLDPSVIAYLRSNGLTGNNPDGPNLPNSGTTSAAATASALALARTVYSQMATSPGPVSSSPHNAPDTNNTGPEVVTPVGLKSKVTVDVADGLKNISDIKARLDDFVKTRYDAKIGVDQLAFNLQMAAVEYRGRAWEDSNYDASFGANLYSLQIAYGLAIGVGQAWANQTFNANFGATQQGPTPVGRATGGIVNEALTLVGERGPELAQFPRGTRIFTNAQTKATMNGGPTSGFGSEYGNTNVTTGDLNFNIEGQGLNAEEIADEVFNKFGQVIKNRRGQ